MALAILLGLAAVPPSAHGQTFTVLYSFKGGTDGASPGGTLVRDAAGNLYGATGGGIFNFGTVFKLDTIGNETVLYSFKGGADGGFPVGGLTRTRRAISTALLNVAAISLATAASAAARCSSWI